MSRTGNCYICVPGVKFIALIWKLYEYKIPQRVLSVIANPDDPNITINLEQTKTKQKKIKQNKKRSVFQIY